MLVIWMRSPCTIRTGLLRRARRPRTKLRKRPLQQRPGRSPRRRLRSHPSQAFWPSRPARQHRNASPRMRRGQTVREATTGRCSLRRHRCPTGDSEGRSWKTVGIRRFYLPASVAAASWCRPVAGTPRRGIWLENAFLAQGGHGAFEHSCLVADAQARLAHRQQPAKLCCRPIGQAAQEQTGGQGQTWSRLRLPHSDAPRRCRSDSRAPRIQSSVSWSGRMMCPTSASGDEPAPVARCLHPTQEFGLAAHRIEAAALVRADGLGKPEARVEHAAAHRHVGSEDGVAGAGAGSPLLLRIQHAERHRGLGQPGRPRLAPMRQHRPRRTGRPRGSRPPPAATGIASRRAGSTSSSVSTTRPPSNHGNARFSARFLPAVGSKRTVSGSRS